MKADAMASALSRAVLGGRHAQSMWVRAEQLNLTETSAGCAMAGVMASRDSAAAITGFIITSPCTRDPTLQRFCADIVRLRGRSGGGPRPEGCPGIFSLEPRLNGHGRCGNGGEPCSWAISI